MDTFQLKVISSDRVFYEGRCKQLIIPAPDGQKGILPHHENMIIAVEIGELHLQEKKETGSPLRFLKVLQRS